ncbi:MAG: T9SS type A sorting domain-containing protein, partial [Bacteroidaceae bacterium]|nr:T9SS type A sorting domain-containing protein [Bacteroidaceae bacterium]
HTVPYDNGGFSVMPINNLKSPYNSESVRTIFRLPKDDQYYDIWDWTKGYGIERRVRVYINDGRAWPEDLAQSVADAIKHGGNANDFMPQANGLNIVTLNNRGRLRSDYFTPPETGTAPEEYEVTLTNEGKGSIGYFLAGNPFICGLDMQKFFEKNSTVIQPYFLVMKDSELDPKNPDLNPNGTSWRWTDVSFAAYDGGSGLQGQTIVPPRYGFFVKSIGDEVDTIKVKYTVDMMVHTPRKVSSSPDGLHYRRFTIQAERDGNQSEATVIKSDAASNKFLPEEDLATFTVSDISSNIPVVYTLTGRLATSINRLHDFLVLPIGIESNSDEPATVTFQGVESLGDSLMLYDAKIDEAVPIYSGMSTRMPGRTQNRFFIVQASSIQRAIAESSLQIYGENGIVVVTSTTGQPITEVDVYDVGGRRVYSAKPDFSEHRFRMPKGVYVVSAKTADLKQVKKFSY